MFNYLMKAVMKAPISILHTIKRSKSRFNKRDLPYIYYVKFNKYQKVLMDRLAMQEKDAVRLLFTHQDLLDLTKEHLQDQCEICQIWRIDTKTVFEDASLLCWSRRTLQNRITFFREMGVLELDAAMVSRFLTVIDMPMRQFKAHIRILGTETMAKCMAKIFDKEPEGVAPLETPSEDLSVREYHNHCLRWYLQWKLDIPTNDTEQMDRVMSNLTTKSLTFIREMFDVLHREVGFTIDELKTHLYLGHGSPIELRRIINGIRVYGGKDFKELIKANPRLIKMEYHNVVRVMKLLERYNFTEATKRSYPFILIMPAQRAAERLAKLESTPELRVLKRSPRALQLIRCPDRTDIRLAYLRLTNLRYATVSSLVATRFDFETFVRIGKDGTKLREVAFAFGNMLRLDVGELRRRLKKHPYCRAIDMLSIFNTIQFLLQFYAPEDLHDSIPLILYPREKIAEVLDEILNSPPATEEERRMRASPRHLLALCLYEIEREHHYTGDGVWRPENASTGLIASRGVSDEEVTDDSDDESEEREVCVDAPTATMPCK